MPREKLGDLPERMELGAGARTITTRVPAPVFCALARVAKRTGSKVYHLHSAILTRWAKRAR